MKPTIFTGAGVALVTPMHADGSVNYEMLGALIDFQIEKGTDAIVACGTTGESATLTHEEHVEVIRYSVQKTAGRVPVIAGTGSNDTAYALELSLEAEKCGADALLLVTPYYNKTSQSGLVSHFTYIADRVNTPMIVYNVPSRTGLDIKPETYKAMAFHPMIAAVKEANGNVAALARSMSLCGGELDFYSGNDDQITSFMSLGAKGVISVLSNILPKETHEMASFALDGDFKSSAALQLKYMDLADALFTDVSPIPVKHALRLMGRDAGPCRLPLVGMEEKAAGELEAVIRSHGLI